MNQLLDKVLLRDKIELKGSIENLRKNLNETKGKEYTIEWISDNKFKFLSKFSIGTLLFGSVDGIKGYGDINEKEEGIEIYLTTKLRAEIYLILVIFFLFFIIGIFEDITFLIWFFLFSPICLFWFWWILRVQENALFKEIKQNLLDNDRSLD